jgi:hypothetical protein
MESLREGATELVGSVAKEVVPEVVHVLDVDAVLREIDVQAIIDRIDLNAVLDRVDFDELVAKLDINAMLAHVDIDALVERTELGALIARSGAGIAGKALDVARSQGVGLDSFVHRWTFRLLRRDTAGYPPGPPLLVQVHPAPS